MSPLHVVHPSLVSRVTHVNLFINMNEVTATVIVH